MTRILALSSFVAAGHVGLSAAAPALARLGVSVIALPTVVLSNHRAWPAVAGADTPPDRLRAMLDAIEANGWLVGLDAVLTGYLPTVEHVAFAAETVTRVRAASPRARAVVDPILGDDPKGLYLPADAAEALRETLAPAADVLTPNRFELEFLARRPAATLDEALSAAATLAAGRRVIVTSPPLGPRETGALGIGPEGARIARAPLRRAVPNGVGDVFAALVAAGASLGAAIGMLDALTAASVGEPHLAIARSDWPDAPAAAVATPSASAE